MTTLKNLKGTAIQFLDADPVEYVGTWSAGGNLNQARTYSGASGIGTQTDSLLFGGRKNSAPATNRAETEKYNGTAWTEVNDLPAAKEGVAGFGTTTNAVSAGGGNSPAVSNPTCTWDGTNWTEVNEINTSREKPKGAGTYTAGLIFSGAPFPSTSAATEEWDGTNWTAGGNLNTARTGVGNAGATQTAALAFGGGPPNSIGNTEEYNGTSWSEKADLNTTRSELGGLGTSTLALAIGGQASPGRVANTESFDGTSWTEVNDLGTARNNGSGSGTGTSGLFAGGNNPNESSATEEWSFPPITATTLNEGDMWFNSSSSTLKGYGTAAGIPAGTWASAANLNGSHGGCGASGTVSTASLVFGGTGQTANTESFNGSSWTEVNNLNQGRIFLGGQGTQTSALAFGGEFGGPPPITAITENWNGSSWTEVNDMNTARYTLGSGTQGVPVTLAVGGWLVPGVSPAVESYDGTSWTEIAEMNVARNGPFVSGDSANAISAGGSSEPPIVANAEVWNGTSWTEVADLNVAKYNGASGGTSTLALASAGSIAPSYVATTEFWNGSSWTEIADLASPRGYVDGAGAGATNQMVAGGNNPAPATNLAEEFTATAAVSTVTTS